MPTRFLLRLKNGPRAGETVEIPVSGLLVGRRPGNDLRLEDPSLSGRHALLRADGDSVQVEDLGSTNGTKVDGERIERAKVRAGAVLTLGKIEFEVALADGDPAPVAPERAEPAGGIELEDEIVLGEPEEATAPAMPALRVREPVPAPEAADREPGRSAAREAAAPTTHAETRAGGVAEEPELELHVEEALASGGTGLRVVPLVLFVAILGAGAWFLLRDGGDPEAEAVPAVAELPGNRIDAAAFSFESDAWSQGTWIHDEVAPRRLALRREAAASGRFGVGFEPEAGEWARLSSRWFDVRAGELVQARATAYAEPGTNAWLALEFAGPDGEEDLARVVSEDARAEPAEVGVTSTVPAGRQRARVVLVAGAPEVRAAGVNGGCGFDDVFLGAGQTADVRRVREDESQLELDAERGVSLTFDRLGRRLGVLRVAAGADPLGSHFPLELGALEGETVRVEIVAPSNAERLLRIDLHPELFGEGGRKVGCVSASGFREYSGQFEAPKVERLLLGSSLDQLMIALPAPVRVIGAPRGEGMRLDVSLGGASAFDVQLGFTEDRGRATTLAAQARRAERDGELGRALARWEELLGRYPFESELVREAETAVGRLSEDGLEELRAVEGDLERASFFRLGELIDECERSAELVARKFASDGSEPNAVEARATELFARIEEQRADLPMQAAQLSELRREAVRGFLEESGRQGIAEALRSAGEGKEER